MKPDIQKRLQDDFGGDFLQALKEFMDWDAEVKGLLDDRKVRSVIHLTKGNFDELKKMKQAAKENYRDVLMWAEYDEFKIQIRDFKKPFGQEMIEDPLEQK
ncbi:hypothetical protein MLD52_17800 [Puniceicoccaceae bacterium K14]|nr:hypothetical protein [Puniceicoccaceae bacterium K14]